LCIVLTTTAASAVAGEFAVLASGFRMRVERHETVATGVRLYTGAEAFIELPAGAVVAFEPEEAVVAPPAPPEPAPVVAPAPAPTLVAAATVSPKELVTRAALQHGLPPEFVHAVVRQESAYRQDAISPKGAIGMMQLMPATAAALNADPYDPEQNVEAGTRHLRDLLVKYKDYPDQVKRALAAYNAGPGAVDKYNGIPPYRETQMYVNRIVERYRKSLPKQ
jgi:soluble lytic murein transglycosylase-like protein